LVVDASQGVEAQTLANVYLAVDNDLAIIPLINKVDLPQSDPAKVKAEIKRRIGIDASDALEISGKTGKNVPEVLERIITDIPAPTGDYDAPLKALIFDSFYDAYRGVVALIRIKEGHVKVGDYVQLMASGHVYQVIELGIFIPQQDKRQELAAGEVGYLAAQIKEIKDVRSGETITLRDNPAQEALPGYRDLNPMVFCGLYPVDGKEYRDLKDALGKLALSDASLKYEPETSQALGFGYRCGFLGLLHMDVIQERLEREYKLNLILTAPSVIYHVHLNSGEMILLDNPSKLPHLTLIKEIAEPYVKATITTPKEYVGPLMELCQNRRGIYIDLEYVDDTRMTLIYQIPLAEIVYNFFDKLKSISRGYASFDYQFSEYRVGNLAKMDILLNSESIDALSTIVHKPSAYQRGSIIVEKLKEIIPRQQFEIPIQASINGKVIARTDIKAVRKDVLAKCYGGDISRKRKLLDKQKEGKKRMKNIGSVEVPQEAFMTVLSIDD